MTPDISIVCASYNKERYIKETIGSVLAQSHKNVELIIVDDCSTDGTIVTIKELASVDARVIFYENTENKGANFCRNKGLREARAPFIIFLDADDILSKHCCERRLKMMKKHAELDLSIHTLQVFQKQPGDNQTCWIPKTKSPLEDFLSHDLPWQTMQPIWKKDFLIKIGGFDESFERMQDVELHTRALLENPLYKLVPGEPDCFFRIDESRKNFSAVTFLHKWIRSASKYCVKFSELLPIGNKKLLRGTVLQSFFQILYHFRIGEISKEEFGLLEAELLGKDITGLVESKKPLLGFYRFYNLQLPRIPGLNRLLKHLMLT